MLLKYFKKLMYSIKPKIRLNNCHFNKKLQLFFLISFTYISKSIIVEEIVKKKTLNSSPI